MWSPFPLAGVVGQQALLPTHQDTKLWLVKTRDGSEREAVVQLLSKHYVLMRQGAPLLIKSAISIDHIKVCVLREGMYMFESSQSAISISVDLVKVCVLGGQGLDVHPVDGALCSRLAYALHASGTGISQRSRTGEVSQGLGWIRRPQLLVE
jgi:hypothetical protein